MRCCQHRLQTASKVHHQANAQHQKTFTAAASKQGAYRCIHLLYHTIGTHSIPPCRRQALHACGSGSTPLRDLVDVYFTACLSRHIAQYCTLPITALPITALPISALPPLHMTALPITVHCSLLHYCTGLTGHLRRQHRCRVPSMKKWIPTIWVRRRTSAASLLPRMATCSTSGADPKWCKSL